MSFPLIIIPVFNAFEQLRACLDSISRTAPRDTRILLIDDASTDVRIQPLLQSWVNEVKSVRHLLTHEKNQGFVTTVNDGMKMAESDVILLNSDTEVTGSWLQNLAHCLDSDASIATATPWSNNGEIVSLPRFCVSNPVPRNPELVASLIKSCGQPIYPEMPTAFGQTAQAR